MRLLASGLALALAALTYQQTAAPAITGAVTGIVVDSSSAPIAGADVQLRVGDRIERRTSTNARGEFRFDGIRLATYDIRVVKDGFAIATSRIAVNDRTPVPVRLMMVALDPRAGTPSVPSPNAAPVVAQDSLARQVEAYRSRPASPAIVGGQAVHGFAAGAAVDFNTEAYDRIDENRFHRVADDPLSTVSIDVDTASYANVRRFLNAGQLPPPDAVRVEELINYFRFGYANPEGNEPFAVTTELAACPWNPRHRLALVGLQARRIDEGRTPPRNLVFLLDVSGSMTPPNKLPLVKSAMRMLVDTLTPADRVAIVVYAGASGLVLPSTPASRKAEILAAIAELQPGGSTNGAAGIQLAYDIAASAFIPNGVNRVLLATDGDFNVGVTNQGDLIRLIEEKRERGIFLSVLGVGTGNLKDSTMEKLADRGNGNYSYLDSVHEARRVLIAEAGATLVTVAKDVKIQVEFNPRTVGAYKLVGYENRVLQHQDFNDDKKDAGEIGAGHSVTALYEIIPPGEPIPGANVDGLKYQTRPESTAAASSGELMHVKLRFKQPNRSESQLISRAVLDRPKPLTENIGFAAAVAQYGMLLRKSELRGQATWASAGELARRFRGDDPDGYRAELARLIDLAATLDTRRQVTDPPAR